MINGEIKPEFVDVDFRTYPEYVAGDVRPDNMEELCASMAAYEDSQPMIDRSQWQSVADYIAKSMGGLVFLIYMILNQGREGSCVGNAVTQGVMMKLAEQFGKLAATALSAISIYKRIGRSPSSGAMVSDALDEVRSRGILPLDTPANRAKFGAHVMPATGFHTPFPSGWEETAKQFKIDEYFVVRTYEGLISALLSGYPVIVGRDGHSITYCGVVFVNGKIYVVYVNSWGKWGMAAGEMATGFGMDSERTIRQSARWAFAIRSVVVPNAA